MKTSLHSLCRISAYSSWRLMRKRSKSRTVLFTVTVTAAMVLVCSSSTKQPVAGSPQLVSIQELPDMGDMCYWQPVTVDPGQHAASGENNLFAAFEETSAYAAGEADETVDITRPPVRTIRDTYPIYSSVAVDTQFNEVVLQDTNL